MNLRSAATVILLRDDPGGPRLLMVRRTPAARFMAGHWVFPGGAVDRMDGEGMEGLRAAARRELAEEAGVTMPAAAEFVPWARWITPERAPIRFDTWFFLGRAPAGASPRVDGAEIVAFRWVGASEALETAASGGFELAFPTQRQLEALARFSSVGELIEQARANVQDIRPVQPRIVGVGADARIVLP